MTAIFDKIFSYRSADGSIFALLIAMMFVRLGISAVFPVTVDEAYAIAVSRVPTLSYFDHPPLAFDFARAAAWMSGSEAPFVVRMPHVVMGTLTGWYLYRITETIYGARAGHIAAAWYSVAPFFFISAGLFVVPDGPLNLFLVLTFWFLLPAFHGEKSLTTSSWCLAGLMMALALMCKYQAVLFGVAIFLALLSSKNGRKVFAQRGPWLALFIAISGLLPMLIWNAQHDWISFRFQTGRAGNGLSFHLANFGLMQLGQMAYLLPGTWAVMLWTIGRSLLKPGQQTNLALAIVAVVPILIFDCIAIISDNSLPHWPMSGFLFAFPLVGQYFAARSETYQLNLQRIFRGLAIALPALAIVVAAQTHTAFLTRNSFVSAPKGDIDWQLVSWSALSQDFEERGIFAGQDSLSKQDSFIVPTNWIVGGRAAYALGPEMPVAAPFNDPRHFALANDPRLELRRLGYIIYHADIGQSAKVADELAAAINQRYTQTGARWTIVQTRTGFPAFEIGVIPVLKR